MPATWKDFAKPNLTLILIHILKRLFDILLALASFAILLVPMLMIALLVKMTSKGPALYWSQRVGKDDKLFWFPKFRSMRTDAPQTMQHLVPEDAITPVGQFIRKYSLDELPQLWPILKGDMSFVGPRPVLPIEEIFLAMRTLRGVHRVKPGLTGWAQINGRAEIKLAEKLDLDEYYVKNQSLCFDIKIIFLTALRVISKEGVVQHEKRPGKGG